MTPDLISAYQDGEDEVLLVAPPTKDQYGVETQGAETAVDARLVFEVRKIQVAGGEERVSHSQVYLDPDLEITTGHQIKVGGTNGTLYNIAHIQRWRDWTSRFWKVFLV